MEITIIMCALAALVVGLIIVELVLTMTESPVSHE
jgi:hypothetical protein